MDAIYRPLLQDSSDTSSEDEKELYTRKPSSSQTAICASLCLSLLVNLIVITALVIVRVPNRYDHACGVAESLYSPAKNAIKYEQRVFSGLGAWTVYHGPPSPETDRAWDSLFPMGISKVSKAEADLLPNATEPVQGDEDNYIVQLDVSHSIHCLNGIRKALYPEYYGAMEYQKTYWDGEWVKFDHIAHCVNTIRESLMCNADITASVWQWEEEIGQNLPRFDTVHVCRNWDAITDWAERHQLIPRFDTHVHVGHENHHHST